VLFRPTPWPQQRRPGPPPTRVAATNAVGSASFVFDAAGVAPIGVGSGAITFGATGVGQWTAAAVGTASISFAAAGVSANIFPLAISSDGRYLKQADGTPFLICADTTWSLAVDIPIASVATFLSTITGQGFNAVMMNIIEHHYTVVKPPKERGGLLPFTKRLDGATYTGSPNGTTGGAGTQGQFASDNYSSVGTQAPDPTFPNNSYWQAVEQILDACLVRNVAVFIWAGYLGFHANDEGWMTEMVAWDAVTGAGGFTGAPFANATKSKMWNYGAWLGDRWKAYPHLIWVMGGDYGSNTQTLDTQQASAVSNLMAGIKSVAGQASTLFTAHWDRPAIATDTTLAAGAFDLNLAYCDEAVAEVCRRGYAHTPTIPAFLGEYFYEDDLFGGSAPFRKYMYWGFLGCVAGGFFGHEQLWRFDDGTPGTDWTTILATQATLDASRQFTFWKSKPWHRLKPSGLGGMGTLVTVGGGTASPQSTTYVAAACTPEGDLLLAYIPPAHTGSITIDMTKMSGAARARWFDPTNAALTDIGVFANTGTRAFTPPATNGAGDTDFLLVLETSSGSGGFAFTAAAVGASLVAVAGSGGLTFAAAGVGASQAQSVGSGSFAFAAAAVSGTVIQATGTASMSFASTAIGTRLVAAAGSGGLAFAAAAVGAAIAVAVGQGSVTFAAAGAGSSTGSVGVGTASFALSAAAVGAARAAGVGTAAIAFAAHGVSDVVLAGAVETFADLVAEMDDLVIEVLG
jgi:Protein of unknown function (DUF4038)/Putative collagen-binding domain of a collagenase